MGAKEVAAGAEWLDENFPGWEREIDLGTLDLKSCQDCICGQSLRKLAQEKLWLSGSGYDYALDVLGHSSRWAEEHGFTVLDRFDRTNVQAKWKATESLWRELIKERFSTGNLSDGC